MENGAAGPQFSVDMVTAPFTKTEDSTLNYHPYLGPLNLLSSHEALGRATPTDGHAFLMHSLLVRGRHTARCHRINTRYMTICISRKHDWATRNSTLENLGVARPMPIRLNILKHDLTVEV